jgi:hypothetical protein
VSESAFHHTLYFLIGAPPVLKPVTANQLIVIEVLDCVVACKFVGALGATAATITVVADIALGPTSFTAAIATS